MKRTSITTLVLLALIGGISGGFVETALASGGRPIVLPPLTLGLALAAIGVMVVVLALPIRRLTRGKSKQPIDPFYSTRVLVLAKASSLGGSLLTGFAIGVFIYLLTRSVVPAVGSIGLTVVTLIGAACLLAGGLIAEHMCTIPPGGDDDDDDGPRRTARVRP
jgi:hypothetical protein